MARRSRFVVCVRNKGYEASLELRKLYPALRDPLAEKQELLRVRDESGEDYLYPATYFAPVSLPADVERALQRRR